MSCKMSRCPVTEHVIIAKTGRREMGKKAARFYLLAQESEGWRRTEELYQQQEKERVPRGTVLKVDEKSIHCNIDLRGFVQADDPYGGGEPERLVVAAEVVSKPSIRMSVLESSLRSISSSQAVLLLSLGDTEQAYRKEGLYFFIKCLGIIYTCVA